MSETKCSKCDYPAKNSRIDRLRACEQLCSSHRFSQNMINIPNYGNIPITKGDLSWINENIMSFIIDCVKLMNPSAVRICNGSVHEASEIIDNLLSEKASENMQKLNRLNTSDATEFGNDRVYIVANKKADELETRFGSSDESWISFEKSLAKNMSPVTFAKYKSANFTGCMAGRTMFVVPYSLGFIGGRLSVNGIQITDDPLFVLNIVKAFRVSSSVWDSIGLSSKVMKGVHSIGFPRPVIRKLTANCSGDLLQNSSLIHQLENNYIWSFGPSYGRSGRFVKTISIRSSSWLGLTDKFLALNAAVLEITDPNKKTIYACYSSVNPISDLELSRPSLEGWRVNVLCENGVWLKYKDNQMYAISPENDELKFHSDMPHIGSTKKLRESIRLDVFQDAKKNNWSSDLGVPISAYIFGTCRFERVPLIFEANSWAEGVILVSGGRYNIKGHSPTSSPTNGSFYNYDPMNIREHLSFNLAKYIEGWLKMPTASGSESEAKIIPQVFQINLHLSNEDGKRYWPGSSENIRIFEWIFKRCTAPTDLSNVTQTAIGKLPKKLNMEGCKENVNLDFLFKVESRHWLEEMVKIRNFFNSHMDSSTKPKTIDKIINDISSKL